MTIAPAAAPALAPPAGGGSPPSLQPPAPAAGFTVHLATHHGLCFGVRDAIAQAEALAADGPLTVLGELAHNPLVRARLAQAGVREADLGAVGSAGTRRVLVTAHGAAHAVQEAWRQAGHTVIDGACPLVRHAHRELAALVAAGCLPVIIGKPGHVEVNGLCGDHPAAVVVDALADIARIPAHPRYGVVSQTTQPVPKVRGLVAELRRLRPQSEVLFRDTVCQPTKERQRALAGLIATCEVIVVVGGRASNNTSELVTTCVRAGRRAHQVERAEEIDPAWFVGATRVGLTAGTSTLPETVRAVQAVLDRLATGCRPAASAAMPPLPSVARLAALPPVPPPPFAAWLAYFEGNRVGRREPDWAQPLSGSPELAGLMARSLAHLQLGESGEGTVLLAGAARVYPDDPAYGAALALFIAEEQEHARLLAELVRRLGGELVRAHWTHACFRRFRHALGVRFELQILLIAELIGTAFYRWLRRRGPEPAVSQVCDLLLADEERHLAFHRERFETDQAPWSPLRRRLWLLQFRIVLSAAGSVAWWDFAPTLRALGVRRRDFLDEIRAESRRVFP